MGTTYDIAAFAAAAFFAVPAGAASVMATSDIVIGDPSKTYGIATIDIGNVGSDYTLGYETLLRIPDALQLVQIATTGGSQIVASNARDTAPDPQPGIAPSGLTEFGRTTGSNLLLSPGVASETVYASVAGTAYFIDTLQLAFLSTTPGTYTVDVTGFSEGYYDYPVSFDISSQAIALDFEISVMDPDDLIPIPLPAGLPLLIGGVAALGVMRRRRAG